MKTEFSKRENEVVVHIASGHSAKEIADLLSTTVNTVHTHLNRVKEKLKAKFNLTHVNVVDITHFAIAMNLVKLKFIPEKTS